MKDQDYTQRWGLFLDSLLMEGDPFLGQLRQDCQKRLIPIIRRETEYYLRWLLAQKRPVSILEIGTAVGYSSIYMASHTPDETTITSIEKSSKSVEEARENIVQAGFSQRITVIEDDALKWISQSTGENYDFIFLDGPKGQYEALVEDLVDCLSIGGILVADNILFDGDILESRYAVRRRDRTIHKRMREFLYRISHHPSLVSDILPIGDGLSISVKIKKEERTQ